MIESLKLLETICKLITSIPSILGIIGSLICYKFFTEECWWIIMTYLVIILLGKCSTTLWNTFWTWKRSRTDIAYYNEKAKERETENNQRLMDGAKMFFLTLSSRQLNMLMEIYRLKGDSTGYCNERIVPPTNSQCYFYAEELISLKSQKIYYDETIYISSCNENYFDNSPRHIWFHPHLYALMENYALNGVKDYPSNYRDK